ncbi:MAG TPA: glycoside hydrolase family 16 protein [Candidatus Limnocylindrales bacterium]|jgi:beta-glucanase (GH16 family)|nr:glycoside hydrolase family 16 protein [Candidatus Limnocylindrales bacterium]
MLSRDPGAGRLFFEDFGAPDLNRSSWNVLTTGPVFNDEVQAYVDSAETVGVAGGTPPTGGVLELRAHHRPGHATEDGQRFDFISGRIDTRGRFAFRHGRAAARIRLPAGPGLWPAFWLVGSGHWPETGEIDVLECVGEPDWVSCAVHGPGYSGDAGLVNRLYLGDTDATAWHTYSVDVTSEHVSFEVDGRLVYRVTRPITEYFGSWAFDAEKFIVLNLALGGGYPYKVNGVREPYLGLPSETVESIRRGDAKMLVDWIRVEALE